MTHVPRAWLVALLAALVGGPTAAAAAEPAPDVRVFTRVGCPRCEAAKAFVAQLAAEDPALVVVVTPVDADRAAAAELEALTQAAGIATPGLPTLVVRGHVLVGFDAADTTGVRMRALLAGATPDGAAPDAAGAMCGADPEAPCPEGASALPGAPEHTRGIATSFGWLGVDELGLPLFTVLLGLVDGFNPCAMWVLLFLLAMLVNLRNRRRMALIAGTFVVASGLVYFVFMAAWLNVFVLIGLSRGVQITLGVVGLVVAAIDIKDFFAFKVGVSLTIPDAAKPGLYARVRRILHERALGASLLGVVALALAVNVVELLCTAGLPAVYTAVLSERGLDAGARYAYLALYNVAYMADDALMVTFALVTLDKARLTERGGRWLKLVSGLVMLLLGVLLVFFPELLF